MNIQVQPSWRSHTVTFDAKPTQAKLKQLILDEVELARGFTTVLAPLPAIDDTWVKVIGNDKMLIVGVCMVDSLPHLTKHIDSTLAENLEIPLSPWNDNVGFVQFIFGTPRNYAEQVNSPHADPDPTGDMQVYEHTPYPEAHLSSYTHVRVRKYVWDEDVSTPYYICGRRMRWLFVTFDTKEIFAKGNVCGFNVSRHRPMIDEFASWNFCSGNGGQDPQSMGRLYRGEPPIEVTASDAQWDGQQLEISGTVSRDVSSLKFSVATDDDARTAVTAKLDGQNWRAVVPASEPRGRLRLYPQIDAPAVEPGYLFVDLPDPQRAEKFTIDVTFDTPDNIITAPYTPKRLNDEMEAWQHLGANRIFWIEYGDWPSFWGMKIHHWGHYYPASIKACGGDMMAAARKAAHDHGLEFYADLKTFDLSINSFEVPNDRKSVVREFDNKWGSAIPEITAHPECTLQAHPDLRTEASGPIRKLRLYSLEPLPKLKRSDVELLTSRDNKKYTAYRKPYTVRVREISRPHKRWTPLGPTPDKGSARNWVIEIDGLDLREPFAAVRIKSKNDVAIVQRAYMAAEATGDGDASQPVTLATNGDLDRGFYCWKGWQGWSNVTEAELHVRKWEGKQFGFVFRVAGNMPGLLEPSYQGSRDIWLGRIQRILDGGADGVSIRTYCHHNGPSHYLRYAYAKPILDTFRQQHSRDPQFNPRDYQLVREIRRDAYTEFMRQARALTSASGKKLMFEFEPGAEIGPEYDCRMQLNIDWERWFKENLVDEVRMKWFTARVPFAHERLIPLARKHGVKVSIISRCLHNCTIAARTQELARSMIGGTARAGFDGFCLYEHQSFMDLNPTGRVAMKGPVAYFMREARASLAEISTANDISAKARATHAAARSSADGSRVVRGSKRPAAASL